MTKTELKQIIKDKLHKYCSGTIDDEGHCYIPSDNYDALIEEIIIPLLEVLDDVLRQSCSDKEEDDKYYGYSRCLSTYARGLRLLAEYGLFHIIESHMRHVVGTFEYEIEDEN